MITSPEQPSTSVNGPQDKQKYFTSLHWSTRADIPLTALLLIIMGLDLLLNISDNLPAVGLIMLAGAWLVFFTLSLRVRLISPVAMPALALLCVLPFSLSISVDAALSLPKVYGVLLGVSILIWLINAFCCEDRHVLVAPALVILSAGLALLGLLSTEWPGAKIGFLASIYNRLAAGINLLPGAALHGRINANSMGGALAFLVPILLALLISTSEIKKSFDSPNRLIRFIRKFWPLIILLTLLLVSMVMFQTQSRGAFLGTTVGVLAVAAWKDRRILWLIPVLLIGLLAVMVISENLSLSDLIRFLDTSDNDTMPGRLEAWRNALFVIQDFPFSGIGIGTYNRIFKEIYLLNPFLQQGNSLFHAHNTLLSVAIDLGIPGLVLYASLLGSFFAMALQLMKKSEALTVTLAVGVASGMLAHQVFGIMDAYALGRNLGELLWIFYGIITALYLNTFKPFTAFKLTSKLLYLFAGIAAWMIISLASIGLITSFPLLSLSIAVTGGLLLGATLVITRNSAQSSANSSNHPVDPGSQPALPV